MSTIIDIINNVKSGLESIFNSYDTGHGRLANMTIEDITDYKEHRL